MKKGTVVILIAVVAAGFYVLGGLAMVDDARLLGRDWGFRLADVKMPVQWWHGESDHVVPIAGVHAAMARLQDAELTVRAESHLGGFAKLDEVLQHVRGCL